MRQDDPRIGQQAAPVAGVMPALAQVDDQVDHVAAARTQEDGRPIGRDARAVGGDQHIRLQETMLVLDAELTQAARAHFLSHLDEHLGVEAEPTALGQHRRKRCDIDAVLALVVGGSAAIEARAFHRERPWRQAGSPRIVEAANGIAVTVNQNGHE